jgi:peroxiredoxin
MDLESLLHHYGYLLIFFGTVAEGETLLLLGGYFAAQGYLNLGGVMLTAYVGAVCGDQMSLYNELLSEFRHFHAAVIGISVDGPWCHAAFAQDRKLHFPLLSDFEPKGAVSRSYGVYQLPEGISQRALFVIDAEGIVRWSYVSPSGINPGADGILEALEQLPASAGAKT